MRLEDKYDWLVLGSDPGALLTGCLVARLGLSVLFLPMGTHQGLTISQLGQPLDPEPNYLIGLGQSGKAQGLILSCLNYLGISEAELARFETDKCAPQVLTVQNRFAFLSNENIQLELQREFGKTSTKQLGLVNALKHTEFEYLNFWQNLPKRLTLTTDRKKQSVEPSSLKDLQRKLISKARSGDPSLLKWVAKNRKLSELVEALGKSEISEAMNGLWYSITSSTSTDPYLFDLLHIFNLSRTGAAYKGGMTAYREFLILLATRLGVQVPEKTECRQIFIDRGRFSGIQVTNRGNMISIGGGVLGCSLKKAQERMTYTGSSFFRRKKTPLPPRGWKFTIALTVLKEGIAPGILSRAVWQEKGAPILEIEVVNPNDYSRREEPGHRVLYLRTVMPFTEESLKLEYQRMVGGRMLRQAVEVLPFLEFHVTRIFPDFRGGDRAESVIGVSNSTPGKSRADLKELISTYGFASLDAIPDNLLLFLGDGMGSSTGVDGLFLVSGESYPQYGNFGSTVAGIEAVAWLAHRSGFAGPLV